MCSKIILRRVDMLSTKTFAKCGEHCMTTLKLQNIFLKCKLQLPVIDRHFNALRCTPVIYMSTPLSQTVERSATAGSGIFSRIFLSVDSITRQSSDLSELMDAQLKDLIHDI